MQLAGALGGIEGAAIGTAGALTGLKAIEAESRNVRKHRAKKGKKRMRL